MMSLMIFKLMEIVICF